VGKGGEGWGREREGWEGTGVERREGKEERGGVRSSKNSLKYALLSGDVIVFMQFLQNGKLFLRF